MKLKGLKDYITWEFGWKADTERITVEKHIPKGQMSFRSKRGLSVPERGPDLSDSGNRGLYCARIWGESAIRFFSGCG